jgi:DNA mismatch repair ATPase MutS
MILSRVNSMVESDTAFFIMKLEPGASTQNVAIDILRQEGFKSTILEEAAQLVNAAA